VPAASAADYSKPVRYRLEVSGQVDYRWRIGESVDCGPRGPGSVTQKFAMRSTTVKLSRSGGRWRVSPARFKVTGTTRLVDKTRPGAAGATPCMPIPKGGCGSSKLSSRSRVELRARRDGLTILPDLGDLATGGKCGTGGFVSFNDFLAAPRAAGMPVAFDTERSLITKSAFGYTVSDKSRGTMDELNANSDRSIQLRFTRLR
jgi:hypothetical protein